jgi:hypothetical protein
VQPAPGAEQRVLERVLGVVERAEHAVAVGVELGSVRLDEAAERLGVAVHGRGEERVGWSGGGEDHVP